MEQHIDNYFKCNIIKHYSNSEKQSHYFFHGIYQLSAENLKKKLTLLMHVKMLFFIKNC